MGKSVLSKHHQHLFYWVISSVKIRWVDCKYMWFKQKKELFFVCLKKIILKGKKIEPFDLRYRIVKPSTLAFSLVGRVRSTICVRISYTWTETLNNGPKACYLWQLADHANCIWRCLLHLDFNVGALLVIWLPEQCELERWWLPDSGADPALMETRQGSYQLQQENAGSRRHFTLVTRVCGVVQDC